MILYIGSNNIYLFNDKFSKMIYKSKKDEINYDKLMKCINKNNLSVVINSFFSAAEHKTFSISVKKQDIKDFIENRFLKTDTVCASYNYLFKKGEGGSHKKDIIMTVIKNDEKEEHIKKIIDRLVKTDLDLSHIYSFEQAVNAMNISFLPLNKYLNINVIIVEDSSLIMVSNTNNYMFSRLIKKRANETILETTIKMLIITLKYINTTYSFLQNEIKITMFCQENIDVDNIKKMDPVFDSISISAKILEMPSIQIESEIEKNDISEIKILKLSINNLKYVNNLTNFDISIHIKVHKFIKILRIFAIGFLISSIVYCVYKYSVGAQLTHSDKEIEEHYTAAIQNVKNEEKKLFSLNEKVYRIIADNFSKNVEDNSHMNSVKTISNVLKKYRRLFFVESYRFEHNVKSNILYVDFALFNINRSIKFVINEFRNGKIGKICLDE